MTHRDRITGRRPGALPRRRDDPAAPAPHPVEQLERESTPLIHLMGHLERRQPRSAAYDDPRFASWLVAEGGWDDDEPLTEAEIAALAARVLATLQAARLGVRTIDDVPQAVPMAAATTASAAVDALAPRHAAAMLDLAVAAGAGRALWDAECELEIPLPPEVLAGRYLALRVRGESMEPLIHPGDVVLVRLDTSPVTPVRDSMVVARTADDGYVVKCVGAVTHRTIELYSLHRAYPPIRVARRRNTVLGVVVLRWCAHAPAVPRAHGRV